MLGKKYRTLEALVEALDAGNRNFRCCVFSGIKITGIKFEGIDFYNSCFVSCELDTVSFKDCVFMNNFDHTGIVDCSFNNCDLSATHFKSSVIENSKFNECSLAQSYWKRVAVKNCEFKRCNLFELRSFAEVLFDGCALIEPVDIRVLYEVPGLVDIILNMGLYRSIFAGDYLQIDRLLYSIEEWRSFSGATVWAKLRNVGSPKAFEDWLGRWWRVIEAIMLALEKDNRILGD